MKAIIAKKYGKADVLQYVDTEKPSVIAKHILVKVKAASINQADAYIMQGKPFPIRFFAGLFKPKYEVLGSDVSGLVEKVGEGVSDFQVGDEIFGQLVINQNGGYAEYALMKPIQTSKKPSNVSFSEAAAIPMAGLTALQGARIGQVKEGSNVLIYGASGGVGTFLIQVCKALGAHVTAVVSTRNIDLAKSSGADHIIDYKTQKWDEDAKLYDTIFGVNGYNKITRYRDKLKENGTYIVVGGSLKQIMEVMLHSKFMTKKKHKSFKSFTAKVTREDLDTLSGMLKRSEIRPFIDKEFPLSEGKDAMLHFMTHQTIGKTIIKVP